MSVRKKFFSEEKNQKTFTSPRVPKYGTWPASLALFFRRETAAAVAVTFATSVMPITMLAGLVYDFGWCMQAKSKLDLAADAAALAAVRTAAAGYAAGQSSELYLAEAQTAATQWWAAQAGNVPEIASSSATPTITQTGQTFTATIAYTAAVNEVMPAAFHGNTRGTATIANTATASIVVHAYGTVDFLLDNTSSMMLPATDADLALLQQGERYWLTSQADQNYVNAGANGLVGWNSSTNGEYTTANLPLPSSTNYCAFACHWSSIGQDYYTVARAVGAKLRFDEVQSATETAIQQMETLEQVNGQLKVGIFAFGGAGMTLPSYLTTVFAESLLDPLVNGVSQKNAGGTAAITALQSITPPISGDNPNTNIGMAISDTLAITGPGGNGNTSASPLKSLILVTDGLEDDSLYQVIPTTEGPINPAVCTAIKDAGYTLYVLYTPYNSEPVYLVNNIALQPYINGTNQPSVLSALQSCASSPSDVIQANSASDIQTGMTTLIDEAIGSTTRMTN
jgi:Flp pilus assembly protein TadG